MKNKSVKFLSEIVEDCSTGKNISSSERKDGKFPFYTCSTTVQTHNEFHYEGEYILFGSRGSIGDTVHLTKGKFALGTSMIMVKPNEGIDPVWLYQVLRGKEKEIKDLISGGGIPQLTKTDLFKLTLSVPEDIDEQKRIAKILSNLDENIYVLKNELKILGFKKAGVISEMFSKGNSELIEDLVKVSSKKIDPLKEDKILDCYELEHIDQGTGIILGNTKTNKVSSHKNLINENQVAYSKLRPYLRKYFKVEKKSCCSSEFIILTPSEKITKDVLYYLVQSEIFNNLANLSCGTKMPRADWSLIEKGLVNVPDKNVLNKYISCLKNMDKLFLLKREELEKLKQLKKGLLNKLL